MAKNQDVPIGLRGVSKQSVERPTPRIAREFNVQVCDKAQDLVNHLEEYIAAVTNEDQQALTDAKTIVDKAARMLEEAALAPYTRALLQLLVTNRTKYKIKCRRGACGDSRVSRGARGGCDNDNSV